LTTTQCRLRAGSAALACLILCGTAVAAPTLKILNHERLDMLSRVDSAGQPHLSFDAYGRHFEIALQPNTNIARAIPAGRSDIQPYLGTVTAQAGSWVRLTHTREGWRGVVSDGQDLYAIEPARDLQASAVQPLPDGGSSSTPVIYRLADAIMPDGATCGTDATESIQSSSGNGESTALDAFKELAKDLSRKDVTDMPARQLVVGVVADHTFTDAVGSDPEGAIVARMDVVDGIWSSQVGIRITLAPSTILTDDNDHFSSTTNATELLSEVAAFRAGLSSHSEIGLTHLMTGRKMDGNIIGIAYLGAICGGAESVSLSRSTDSTIMGALIAAHELGHNFNAIHDGVPGVCSTTPQIYLMAPVINFSEHFSECSLTQIKLRAMSASCLAQVAPTAGGSPPTGSPPTSSGSPTVSTYPGGGDVGGANGSTGGTDSTSGSTGVGNGGGGSLDLAWLVILGGALTMRQARALQRITQTPPTNPSHPPERPASR
jgi:hypothetical protein